MLFVFTFGTLSCIKNCAKKCKKKKTPEQYSHEVCMLPLQLHHLLSSYVISVDLGNRFFNKKQGNELCITFVFV